MRATLALASMVALAGCAGRALAPAAPTPTLTEVTPRFQVACSARGLRPGTEAFEGCVADEVAAWRGTRRDREVPGPSKGAGPAPGASGAAECRLSPLGGYICERPRPRPSP